MSTLETLLSAQSLYSARPSTDLMLTDDASTNPEPAASTSRPPRQERGQRRLDEILDAAESLITEVGPAACSIQEIAKRAGASVGSVYHFFPTKDAIFSAIRARYDVEASAIAANILTHATEWARLDLEDFVHHVMSPFADFLERIPAFFALASAAGHKLPKNKDVDATVRAAMLTALAHRWPDATPEARAMRVDVMMAIGDGVSNVMVQADPAGRRLLVAELTRAVYGYLSTFERAVHLNA